ncbi:MAG: PAS domain-containing protein [Candidatus Omnitrophica bacterium]|nr:PAS domain-containing protein [Candidatus Omnitrophota bacterium]
MTESGLTRALLSSLRDAILEMDERGSLLWANPTAELLLSGGVPPAGLSLASFAARPEEGAELLADLACAGSGELGCSLELMGAKGQPFPCDLLVFREEGWRHFLAVIRPHSGEGESSAHLAEQILDLTHRLAAVQKTVNDLSLELIDKTVQLAEERNKTEAVLASMGEGLVVVEPSGRISQINSAACRILDTTPELAVGKSLGEPSLGAKLNALADSLRAFSESRALTDTPMDRLTVQEKVIELSLASIQDREGGAESVGTVVNVRDITRRAEIDRMKEELISVVSHELRAPLANVIGYIDLLLNEAAAVLSKEHLDFVAVARKNAERLIHLVDEMLDLSRLDAGAVRMDIQRVDMAGMIDYALTSFRAVAESRRLTITRRIEGEVAAAADVERLQQVLHNLISNAVKYSRDGGEVVIACRREGREVVITVADNGIGIRPEDQARLFQRFFRVRGGETRSIKGTGLGLSIAKSIVDSMSGRLTVTSEYGKGSAFSVILPAWRE